jgi:hypothetical protein
MALSSPHRLPCAHRRQSHDLSRLLSESDLELLNLERRHDIEPLAPPERPSSNDLNGAQRLNGLNVLN